MFQMSFILVIPVGLAKSLRTLVDIRDSKAIFLDLKKLFRLIKKKLEYILGFVRAPEGANVVRRIDKRFI